MNQKDWDDRCQKRELRALYRTRRMEYEQSKRPPGRKEKDEIEARIDKKIEDILKADNKKCGKPEKKPGARKYLELYSFITYSPFDSRGDIPFSWKPRSFNERNQHLEFFKSFIYPYEFPETLLWASHCEEYFIDHNGKRAKKSDFEIIQLTKKWIKNIVSGDSFYKLNKQYFSKSEAHHFLSSKILFTDSSSVMKMFFYAKSRARMLSHKVSLIIADVFTIRFSRHFENSIVESFLDMLARTPEYGYDKGLIGDLSDFVLEKLQENKKIKKRHLLFTFSGRTITSVIKLTNEWHESLRREETARQNQREAYRRERNRLNEKPSYISKWDGMGLTHFRYETTECIWTIIELKTSQDLLNEGRKMKNCIASYANRCAAGDCAIFTVEKLFPFNQQSEKTATLEVIPSKRTLIQAKGKCNSAVPLKTLSIIKRWASTVSIKTQLLI